MMPGAVREVLLGIRTIAEMVEAFRDEEGCRRLLEAMVWPNGRVCPACGYKRSIALAGRDMGRYRARPGLYQCCNGACRFQFTATTRTPLHATKLPLSTWLKAWRHLREQLQPFPPDRSRNIGEAGGIAARMCETLHEALRDGFIYCRKNDRYGRHRLPQRRHRSAAHGYDHVRRACLQ